ncbi:hypothetical protein C8R42DRAFT_728542 [Lentinula raphanica]|nr:hypothetical protein C8R42DRAFT_728542 [Lentinula raphanica]
MRFSILYPTIAIFALPSTVASMPTRADEATIRRNRALTEQSMEFLQHVLAHNPSKEFTIIFRPYARDTHTVRNSDAMQDAENRVELQLAQHLGYPPCLVFDSNHRHRYDTYEQVRNPIQYTLSVDPTMEFRVALLTQRVNNHIVKVVLMWPSKVEDDYPSCEDLQDQLWLNP